MSCADSRTAISLLAGQLAEHGDDLLLAAEVEVGQRLVEQQQLRPGDQRVRDQHPLLLAAGELADPGVGVPGRADVGQRRLDLLAALPRREAEAEPVPVEAERTTSRARSGMSGSMTSFCGT